MRHHEITETNTHTPVVAPEYCGEDDERKMSWRDSLATLSHTAVVLGFCVLLNMAAA